jgi:hypothetical protein
MILSSIFGRRNVNPNPHVRPRRRPVVESLEGRQLQSGIIGNHIGLTAYVTAPRDPSSGLPAAKVANHIGVTADVATTHVLNPQPLPPGVRHVSMD